MKLDFFFAQILMRKKQKKRKVYSPFFLSLTNEAFQIKDWKINWFCHLTFWLMTKLNQMLFHFLKKLTEYINMVWCFIQTSFPCLI